MSRHNKKRNVGVVYEALVRRMVDALVCDDPRTASIVLDIIKRHFSTGTALHNEWVIVNTLKQTTNASEKVADGILDAINTYVQRRDVAALNNAHDRLIHEVNCTLGRDVFDTRLPDNVYRFYATVTRYINCASALNEGRGVDVATVAELRERLIEHMTSNIFGLRHTGRLTRDAIDMDPETNAIVSKLLAESLNEVFAPLNRVQRRIMTLWTFDGPSSSLRAELRNVKEAATTAIVARASATRTDVADVLRRIDSLPESDLDDATIAKYMQLSEVCE